MFINNDNVTLSNLMVITVTVRDAGLNVKYNTIITDSHDYSTKIHALQHHSPFC